MLHIALYVLRRLADGDEAPLRAALRAAEAVLRTGDVGAQGLVEFGLIEELCNRDLWPPGVDGRQVLAAMGPRARLAKCVQDLAASLSLAGRVAPRAPGEIWWADIWLRGRLLGRGQHAERPRAAPTGDCPSKADGGR